MIPDQALCYNEITQSKECPMAEKNNRTRKAAEEMFPEEVINHFRTARKEMRESLAGLVPPEFIEHRRKARKEMLLAWRSMIDASLKRMEEKEK
jgi:hypothetical protein